MKKTIALALAAGALFAVPSAAVANIRQCSTKGWPFHNLTTRHVDCFTGRTIASQWYRIANSNGEGLDIRTHRVFRYTCRSRLNGNDIAVRCTWGTRVVHFHL
jgi:hypothetical protein